MAKAQLQVAPCMDRCIAFIIDDFLNIIPTYYCWKDGIRDGQSFGKGLIGNLRVVKYDTGQPATIGDSLMRNCGESIATGCTCGLLGLLSCFWLLFDSEHRRLGDRLAGTIVIRD
ncbi:MAG: RDD family protein [Candidatus Hodarchaeales archaeon]|jgi:uncharacterized RDD family membrane protein YckC